MIELYRRTRPFLQRNDDSLSSEEILPLTCATRLDGIDDEGACHLAATPLDRHPKVTPRWMQRAGTPKQWLSWILPFFIAAPLGLTDRSLPRTSSTTYLNGVRGLACCVVLNHHLGMKDFEWLGKPYGAGGDQENNHFFQLPIVRAVHAGKGMVCVFFVLSGFVLSYSSLRRINEYHTIDRRVRSDGSSSKHDASSDYTTNIPDCPPSSSSSTFSSSSSTTAVNRTAHVRCLALDLEDNQLQNQKHSLLHALVLSLSSSFLRRPIRLFLPLLVLVLLTAVLVYFPSVFSPLSLFFSSSSPLLSPADPPLSQIRANHPTFPAFLRFLYLSELVPKVLDPYAFAFAPRFYGARLPAHVEHAWTLAAEFRLSLLVFLVLAGVAAVPRSAVRMLVFGGVAAWALWTDRRWDVLCFMGGMGIAEMRVGSPGRDVGELWAGFLSVVSGRGERMGRRRLGWCCLGRGRSGVRSEEDGGGLYEAVNGNGDDDEEGPGQGEKGAEMNRFLPRDNSSAPSAASTPPWYRTLFSSIPGTIAILLGLLLVSVPERDAEAVQPYAALWSWTLPRPWRTTEQENQAELSAAWIWWYGGFGAVALVWGLERLPRLQGWLSARPLAYLGEISYSFYLLQGLGQKMVGDPVFRYLTAGEGAGDGGDDGGGAAWSAGAAFWVAYASSFAVVVVCSDYYWRLVDENSVRLARIMVHDWIGVVSADRKGK